MEPTYLGDGIFIIPISNEDWELYTWDGRDKTNVIILDTETGYKLLRYLEQAFGKV